jgi:pimeloyl-ACP methyl ester carboxylesterase
MREALNLDPIGAFKNIKMPVSIVGGRLDETASPLSAVLIDRALEEGGNASRAMTYFDKCGHLLAKRINDGTHRMHYQIDALAAETLKNWLESNLSQPPPAEALPPPQDDAKPSQK